MYEESMNEGNTAEKEKNVRL